jgi:hypothetical protein
MEDGQKDHGFSSICIFSRWCRYCSADKVGGQCVSKRGNVTVHMYDIGNRFTMGSKNANCYIHLSESFSVAPLTERFIWAMFLTNCVALLLNKNLFSCNSRICLLLGQSVRLILLKKLSDHGAPLINLWLYFRWISADPDRPQPSWLHHTAGAPSSDYIVCGVLLHNVA